MTNLTETDLRDDFEGIISTSDFIDKTADARFAVHPKLGGSSHRTTVCQAVQRRSSRCARDRRVGAEQVHRRASGTAPITVSMCLPQPVQVVLPQPEHRAGEHIGVSFFGRGEAASSHLSHA